MKKVRIKREPHAYLVRFYSKRRMDVRWKRDVDIYDTLASALKAVDDFLSRKKK